MSLNRCFVIRIAILSLAIVGGCFCFQTAFAENSVSVESKTVPVNASGVEVGVFIINDDPLGGMSLPLEIRSTTPGSYITGSLDLQVVPGNRLVASWPNGFVTDNSRYPIAGNSCSGPVSHGFIGASTLDFVSPDGALFAADGLSDLLPSGSDPVGTANASLKLVFNVSGTPGTFEIDTCCISHSFTHHLAFYLDLGYQSPTAIPSFTKGTITLESLPDDNDADGIPDSLDNCVSVWNPSQVDGDEDGIGDVCDNCPSNGIPDQTDADSDGVGNLCDNCPAAPNPNQEDSDGDGIADACDNCPSSFNTDQANADGDGLGDVCDTLSGSTASFCEDFTDVGGFWSRWGYVSGDQTIEAGQGPSGGPAMRLSPGGANPQGCRSSIYRSDFVHGSGEYSMWVKFTGLHNSISLFGVATQHDGLSTPEDLGGGGFTLWPRDGNGFTNMQIWFMPPGPSNDLVTWSENSLVPLNTWVRMFIRFGCGGSTQFGYIIPSHPGWSKIVRMHALIGSGPVFYVTGCQTDGDTYISDICYESLDQSDLDGDGVITSCDNCVSDFNPGQENVDGDLLGDDCDPDQDAADWMFTGYSPIALVVTTPEGDSIGPGVNTIGALASYDSLTDYNGDNDPDDRVTILGHGFGSYSVRAISRAEATPGSTYSIGARVGTAPESLIVVDAPTEPPGESQTFAYDATCSCPCYADPTCDGVRSNVQDVVGAISVAFRGVAGTIDPGCTKERTDVDANGFTDVTDVVRVVNVAFRGNSVASQYVDPCL